MLPAIKKITFITVIVFLVMSCTTVPVTERRQLNLIPKGQILSLSYDQYDQFLDDHEVITGTEEAAMVKRVGGKIKGAVEAYLRNNGQGGLLDGYKWEFNLIADDSANAFAMPGGKVVVFTGILPIAAGDSGLATVMGHEVAHAIAGHGNERMSQAMVAQMGGMALGLALSNNSRQTQELFMAAYGVGAQVGVLLPYSRLQESEADQLGLIFMAMAGYDPHEAINFWQRMDAQKGKGGAPPEFLSTHPGHDTRIQDLKRHLPQAMKYYRP